MKAEFPQMVENNGLAKRYPERYQFDAKYIQRLLDRDEATEEHFISYFGDLLTVKLRSRLRQADMVEDAKQDTLMRVINTLRNKGGIDSPQALGAYVNSVCNNVLFETYRRDSKSPTLSGEMPDVQSSAESIEATLVTEERRKAVRETLASLKDKDRRILYQIFYQEREKDEVCRQFGVNREYLRVLVHRAKNRLRDALAKSA